jgi:hypothetical protein
VRADIGLGFDGIGFADKRAISISGRFAVPMK